MRVAARAGRTNLRDVGVVRSIREQEAVYRFGNELEWELDVSKLSPQEATQRVVEHITKNTGRERSEMGSCSQRRRILHPPLSGQEIVSDHITPARAVGW
jgi:hypothetical protein